MLKVGLLVGELFTESARPVCSTRAIFVKEINNPSENEEGSDRGSEEGLTDRQTRTNAQICPKSWNILPESHEERRQRAGLGIIHLETD